MGALKNIKHEKFAQGIALGMPASPAYVKAGYVKNDGNASRLKLNEKVLARVRELAEGAAKRSAKTLDQVVAEYERIAFFQLGDFITIDEDGNPKYDLSKCTKDQMSLMHVEESTRRIIKPKKKKKASDDVGYDIDPDEDEETHTEIVTFTVKPPDRLKALEKLGMHLGMGDKAANQTTDRLADAIREISIRGSAAPMRKPKY